MDWRPVQIDYFTQPREALTVTHFASGASATGDMRGFARLLYPFGVALSDLGDTALHELLDMAHLPIQLFIDSGAFSEVEFVEGQWIATKPIGTEEWVRRLRVAYAIAAVFGERALVVAPDRVGDQQETLVRLYKHADVVRAISAIGARVVVPIQIGAMAAVEFDTAASRELGFGDYVRGIPGNKAAMSTREVKQLVRASGAKAVHLLGVGLQNQRFGELVQACRAVNEHIEISCDSNLIAAHVGRANGRGGQPRPMTAAETLHAEVNGERSRESAIVLAFGPAIMWRKSVLDGLQGTTNLFDGVGIAQRSRELIPVAKFAPPKRKTKQLGFFNDIDE